MEPLEPIPQIINLPKFLDRRGNLSFIEQGQHIPFDIARTYWVYDVPGIPFLSLKDVTAAHGEENARFGKNPPSFQPGASNSFRFVSLLHTILSKS